MKMVEIKWSVRSDAAAPRTGMRVGESRVVPRRKDEKNKKSVRFAEIQEIRRKKTTEQFNSELMVAVLSQRSGWGNRPPYFNFKFRLLLSPGRQKRTLFERLRVCRCL